ncbi:MAG: hypothetical protein ACHQAY_23285 [Hyphomicrobiales bacterium]
MSVDAYLKARAAFVAKDKVLKDTGLAIRQVGELLSSTPGRVIFGNIPGLGVSASNALNAVAVDANQWLSARQIMEMIIDWDAKKREMMTTWGAIPVEIKAGLQPPPK